LYGDFADQADKKKLLAPPTNLCFGKIGEDEPNSESD
jgi:hypothetical protein